ncbi:uncharacterized protein LOC105028374 [Esox lucius]|uniref:uncharacterized protein LOC105028374 n=1 Tax=Esox lucius TaxID=8010 RepID=UPI0014774FDF|nr:uncharacterized protein LOC105028374 [Esox lucius]
MLLALPILLSVFSVGSVSAGGSWCAKTARARAAAMGLVLPKTPFIPYGLPSTQHGSHDPKRTHYENKNDFREAELGSPSDWAYGQVFTRGVQSKPSTLNHRASEPQQVDSLGNYAPSYRGKYVSSHVPDFERLNSSPELEAMVLGSSEEGNSQDNYIPNLLAYRRDPVVFQHVSSRPKKSWGVHSRPWGRGPFPYGQGLLPVQRLSSPHGPGHGKSLVSRSPPPSSERFRSVGARGSADGKIWTPGPVYSPFLVQRADYEA